MDLARYPPPAADDDDDGDNDDDDGPGGAAPFRRTGEREVVVFCGRPGAGKSTFYRRHLEPLGYKRVNQDALKTRDKCIRVAKGYLDEGASVVVDNTNPDPETRRIWIDLAQSYRAAARCVWFTTPAAVCRHNDAVRALSGALNPEGRGALPEVAFRGFDGRYRAPRESEGFRDVTAVDFCFRGSREEYDVWGRYWV